MTQEELNRLDTAHKLEGDINTLRMAAKIVSNSPMTRGMSDSEKQHISYAALGLVSKRLPDLFEDEAVKLSRRLAEL